MKRSRILCLSLALLLVGLMGISGVVVAQEESDPENGARLYLENCAVCHGLDGKGRQGAMLAKPFASVQPEAFVRQVLLTGVIGATMPAWSQEGGGPLTDKEIEDLIAFVVSLGGEQAPSLPTPTLVVITPVPTRRGEAGDPNRGVLVYVENCFVCHGEDGRGRIGARLAKAFPAISPSAFIKEVTIRGIDGSVMPAWLNTMGGPLTLREVNDVAAYVASLPPIAEAISGGGIVIQQPGSGERTLDIGTITGGIVVLVAIVILAAIGIGRLRSESVTEESDG